VLAIFLGAHSFVNNTHVGLLVAFASLVTAVAQPLWGVIADHAGTKNRILAIVHIGIACMAWLFILPRHNSFLTLIPSVFILYSLVYSPMSLIDAIVVENLDKVRLRYGVIRAFGSGGAALAAFSLFIINSMTELRPQHTFIILFCTTLLALIPLKFIPRTVGYAHKEMKKRISTDNRKDALKSSVNNDAVSGHIGDIEIIANDAKRPAFDFTTIFQNKRLMLLLAYGLFTFICIGCQNTYFSVYYATERGLNAGVGMYGLLFTVCIASEAAVMSLGNRFYTKLNIYSVFTIIQISACIRSLIMFLSPNANLMFVMAIFHGHIFGLLFLRVAPYIGGIVSEEMRATGQACWSVMLMGLGPVIGSAFGGLITLKFDLPFVFLFASIALLIITIIFFVLFRRQRSIDRKEGFVAA
jgi:PPP family 3-phenylpropionic acid transporter